MSENINQVIKQFLTFKLNEETFGIDVIQIREILEYTRITKIPQTPESMCGVINLRGNVVPVIDLRLKFEMGKMERTVNTCIIVIEIEINDERMNLGALVDSVQEVIDLEPEDIEAVPKLGTKLKTEFIRGMGRKGNQFIILLDINKVFSAEELVSVKSTREIEL